MIQVTIFDPLSGRAIAYVACSHEEEVWNQPQVGQGFVAGWREAGWLATGDEGFVRDLDGFHRTRDWLDRHWPALDLALTSEA